MDASMIKTGLVVFSLLQLFTSTCLGTQIYGHRGAAGLATEHTLIAYKKALDLGVDVLDMDVSLSQDGVVMVHHDLTLKPDATRLPDGQWLTKTNLAIKDLTANQLKKYNVGTVNPKSQYAKNFPFQTSYGDSQIPTLQEVIQFAKAQNPQIRFQIEIKTDPLTPNVSSLPSDIIPKVIAILKEENVIQLTEVHSFDWRNLFLLEKLAPEVTRSFITQNEYHGQDDNTWTAGPLLNKNYDSFPKLIKALNGDVWCPKYDEITAEDVKMAHSLGLKVNAWSVDEPVDMLKMIGMEVDGIITNRPDILKNLLVVNYLAAYK